MIDTRDHDTKPKVRKLIVTVGERIRELRIQQGMSQDELAQKVGYKWRSAISKVENGERDISQSMIVKYAEALMTTPEYLMGWDENPEPHPAPSPDTERDELINRLLTLFAQLTAEEQQFVLTMIETMIQKH